MKIIYFGTPQFAAEVLDYLIQHGVDIAAVITKPDRPQGRSGTPVPTPVKSVALAQNPPLPLYQPEIVSDLVFAPTLEAYQADLFVVVAYGEILREHLLAMPKVACINLHASLLPKYRGAAPIQRSIIDGESETGVTIMHMAKKMDAGDIISMHRVPITINMTYGQLEQELCNVGSKALLETIHSFENHSATRVEQNHELMTLAPKIELEDCEIKWNLPSLAIHNLVRGVNPHPGAWCYVDVKGQKKRLKIISTRLGPQEMKEEPGKILQYSKEGFLVACSEGSLFLENLQLEGKKAIAADEFIRGLPEGSIHFMQKV